MSTAIIQKKDQLLADLSGIKDSESKYKFIIDKGRSLPPLADDQKQDKYLIEGCISRAWLVPELRGGKIYFYSDSEAAIVKGIMAIILEVYSGNTPADVLDFPPDFLREGGITEHLSMNRRNGLSGVLKQIKLYAAAYKALARGT
jgi:cysteine desulfuration protein SufE